MAEWIPVTERLPKKGVYVLCACRANIYSVMKWDGIDWCENPTHIYMAGFVTHWMPLPEPPTGGDANARESRISVDDKRPYGGRGRC